MSLEDITENLDSQYLDKLEGITFQPVFILGLNRSGTSILYKMLSATQYFNSVTIYHIIKYNQLIYNKINKKEEGAKRELTSFFQKQGQIDRVIDQLELTADFVDEYGFLLGNRIFMRKISPKNLPTFIEIAKKIQFISDKDKLLLLKNPLDFQNFIYIKKVFPDAKFVFIHRDPIKVISSLVKALQILFENKKPLPEHIFRNYNKAFENPLLLRTIRFCLSDVVPIGKIAISLYITKSIKYYLKNIESLPKDDYICVLYKDLCENPQKNLESIMKFLNVKTNNIIDFKSYIKPREDQLDRSIIKMQGFISKNMRDYFRYIKQLEKQ